MSTWTIGSVLNWTKQYFGEKGLDTPRLDAEVLLCHILQKERIYLYVNFDQPLEQHELTAYKAAILKRAQGVPAAYITGHKEFMALDFFVNPNVLIPRPDTEILVEAALIRLKEAASPLILDLGTGSGAIVISLLYNLPSAKGIGVDISNKAAQTAKMNCQKYKLEERLEIVTGDLFVPVAGKKFAAIISNPPYIVDAEVAGLSREVRQEPFLALRGGVDGLDFYRRILQQAADFLQPNGFVAFEVGIGQAAAVAEIAPEQLEHEQTIKDYAGIDRVVVFRLKGA